MTRVDLRNYIESDSTYSIIELQDIVKDLYNDNIIQFYFKSISIDRFNEYDIVLGDDNILDYNLPIQSEYTFIDIYFYLNHISNSLNN